jgi:hypothetical protein
LRSALLPPPLRSAVNADTGSVFAFWQDSDVARKGGEAGAAAAPDSSIVGAWKLALTADGTAAQDIFFLRQLHREEAEHKLVDPGAAAHGGVDPSLFAGEPLGGDVPGARAAMRRAAERYSEMWQGSSPGPIAEEVLAENFEEADLTRGSGLRGRPDFVAMINKVGQGRRRHCGGCEAGMPGRCLGQCPRHFLYCQLPPCQVLGRCRSRCVSLRRWPRAPRPTRAPPPRAPRPRPRLQMADAHSGWVSDSSELDIGVAEARSVAFVHWASSGSFGRDGPTAKISGFSLLVFDPREPGRIRRAAGFRQPSPQERQKLLRPGAFAHAAPAAEA